MNTLRPLTTELRQDNELPALSNRYKFTTYREDGSGENSSEQPILAIITR